MLRALAPIDIRMPVPGSPPPPPATVSPATVDPGTMGLSPLSDAWTVTLRAEAGDLLAAGTTRRDDYNAFGVHPDARVGWDALDAGDGGTLNTNHVVLRFANQDMNYARDIRPPPPVGANRVFAPSAWANTRVAPTHGHDARATESHGPVPTRRDATLSWSPEIHAHGTGPVTLHWSELPAGYRFTLIDGDSGAIVDMHATRQYRYTPEPDDDTRSFAITADAVSAGEGGSGSGDSGPGAHGHDARATESRGGCVSVPATDGDVPAMILAFLVTAFAARRRRKWGGETGLT